MIIRCYFDPMNAPSKAIAAQIKTDNPTALVYTVNPSVPFPEVPGIAEGYPTREHRACPAVFIDTDDSTQEHTRLEADEVTAAKVLIEVSAVRDGQRTPYAIPRTPEPKDLSYALLGDDGKVPSSQLPPPSGPQRIRKTADQTSINAVLANATDLVFTVQAGVTYRFRFFLIYRSTVATVGFKCGVTFPAVTIFAASARVPVAADGVAQEFQGALTSSGDSVVGSAAPAINTDYIAIIEGIIRTSSGGTLQVQFSAETTGATVTLRADSLGLLEAF